MEDYKIGTWSSSTVGKNPVLLNTDELHVVVDTDDIRMESCSTAAATDDGCDDVCESAAISGALPLELQPPARSSSIPESS
jgi:hypothetical protein